MLVQPIRNGKTRGNKDRKSNSDWFEELRLIWVRLAKLYICPWASVERNCAKYNVDVTESKGKLYFKTGSISVSLLWPLYQEISQYRYISENKNLLIFIPRPVTINYQSDEDRFMIKACFSLLFVRCLLPYDRVHYWNESLIRLIYLSRIKIAELVLWYQVRDRPVRELNTLIIMKQCTNYPICTPAAYNINLYRLTKCC